MKILASFCVGTDSRDGLCIDSMRAFVKAADEVPEAFPKINDDLSDHRSVCYDLIDPASLSDHPALARSAIDERTLKLLAKLHTDFRRHKTPSGDETFNAWRERVIHLLRLGGYYVERGIPEYVRLRADDHELRKVRGERWIFIDGKKAFKIYEYKESDSE